MSKTQNTYSLPVPSEAITETVRDNQSHQGSYEGSIDFTVPIGTPVLAAYDGTVSRVRDDSDKYGKDRSFGSEVNYVTI